MTTAKSDAPVPTRSSELFARMQPHFRALDAFLHGQLADFEPEIRELVSYCVDTSGKRLRPTLVFFSGWQGDGVVSEALVRVAAVIEMVHMATLVHDDIMDKAVLRRSRDTATRKFGPDTAVLLGDALFSQALHVASQFSTTEVCRHVSASTRQVCSGEIMQTLAKPGTNRDENYYRRVIQLKTAELFQVSCYLGSRLTGAEEPLAKAIGKFGRHLGTAYQIFDDLADFFGDESKIGKTLGTDLASGKATLPLLLLIERLPATESANVCREMAGGDVSQLRKRVAQMTELGVFDSVVDAIRKEIRTALNELGEGRSRASADLLRSLADMVLTQTDSLKPRHV